MISRIPYFKWLYDDKDRNKDTHPGIVRVADLGLKEGGRSDGVWTVRWIGQPGTFGTRGRVRVGGIDLSTRAVRVRLVFVFLRTTLARPGPRGDTPPWLVRDGMPHIQFVIIMLRATETLEGVVHTALRLCVTGSNVH